MGHNLWKDCMGTYNLGSPRECNVVRRRTEMAHYSVGLANQGWARNIGRIKKIKKGEAIILLLLLLL